MVRKTIVIESCTKTVLQNRLCIFSLSLLSGNALVELFHLDFFVVTLRELVHSLCVSFSSLSLHAKIRIEDTPLDYLDRIILVNASTAAANGEVSTTQGELLKVFNWVLDIIAETVGTTPFN